MNIGEKIVSLRKEHKMTQEDLANKLNVSRQTISHWELNETSPDLNQARQLAEIFHIDLNTLVGMDTTNVIVEKVSNTEKLAGLVYKLLKIFIVVCVCLLVVLVITAIMFAGLRTSQNVSRGDVIEEGITCTLHDETYNYNFKFYEGTGEIIEAGGDGYFGNITDVEKYDDAYVALDHMKAYVENNGGYCE